ncbi:hypothetical protein [Photobacterium alginatilyticum]|uniref:Uncharacterized protein n=1 Tax=Photobacterium alginatilyticum TaxID=1775171 RepID=A0ABW9YRV5_9GAMM|nr:hypothetical protein [Photobacterium alginatilyticum]NBI56415.1 hypothetical protein [Photobacterium alginatilyticum]
MYELDKELYVRALQLFDGELAGECANVSNAILQTSSDILDNDVTINVGWVEIEGESYFEPSESDEVKDVSGRNRFNYHVWLEGQYYFIDLTLIPTLRDMHDFDDSWIPDDIVCIGIDERESLGVVYHVIDSGDDVLEEFRDN